MKPHHTERWYDRHTRLWVVQLMTVEGFQIGAAEYVHGKGQAINIENEMKKDYSI